jgi:hypothetical protein
MRTGARRALVAAMTGGTLVTGAGCGEPAPAPGPGAGSAAPGAPAPSATSWSPSGVTDVTVTVARGKATVTEGRRPVTGRVKVRRGGTVRITVTGDAADEFHLHGYDETLALRPGRPATLRLVAGIPGVFEAELHHSGARVFELQVS